MIRRRFLALSATAFLAVCPAFGQPQRQPKVIGFLWERAIDQTALRYVEAFKSGMRELGYAEGVNYSIVSRSAPGELTKLPALATELLALKPDLIVSSGTSSAIAARRLTSDIPILIVTVSDPVGSGLATSLSRPGGNVTGLTGLGTELYPKRLDLLRQIVPNLQRVGVVYNPAIASDKQTLATIETACERFNLKVSRAAVPNADAIVPAFDILKRDKVQGVFVTASSTNIAWREKIIDEAAKKQLPAIYGPGIFTESGGLISYAPKYVDLYRRAATYVDKLFKGAKPGDLPIEQPLTFELVINMKTAKALELQIPQAILVRADRLIE